MACDAATSTNGEDGPSDNAAAVHNNGRATLDDVMRAPSTVPPEVVVLDSPHSEKARKEILNPREDLWLSSADGRYNAPIIPLRVGTAPNAQVFYVHRAILLKTEYFEKALCGHFREADTQSIELPEEDPAIFHFLIAFLYEGTYVPIKPIATALGDKGKAIEAEDEALVSDSDSSAAGDDAASDSSSARSRRRRAQRRRREDQRWQRLRQKHPGAHRIECGCRQCLNGCAPPCWHCLAPRYPPPPPPPHIPPAGNLPRGVVVVDNDRRRARIHRRRDRPPTPPPPLPPASSSSGDRITGEDLRSWLLTYELNLDVYICANKFLLDDFKECVARVCIDMLEMVGADAAQPEVLRLCRKLYEGLPESDTLVKMIFARVGFLQSLLWKSAPQETHEFLLNHPEISTLILKETVCRRDQDHGFNQLPPMERPYIPPLMDSSHPRPGTIPMYRPMNR